MGVMAGKEKREELRKEQHQMVEQAGQLPLEPWVVLPLELAEEVADRETNLPRRSYWKRPKKCRKKRSEKNRSCWDDPEEEL